MAGNSLPASIRNRIFFVLAFSIFSANVAVAMLYRCSVFSGFMLQGKSVVVSMTAHMAAIGGVTLAAAAVGARVLGPLISRIIHSGNSSADSAGLQGEAGAAGDIDDITERKKVEAALRRWADAFNYCAHGIAIGNASSNCIMICNPAYARLQGRTVEEVAGSPISTLYDPSERERLSSCISESDHAGHSRCELYMLHRNGSTFPVQLDLVSVFDENGRPLYRVATIQDITERKCAEDGMRSSLEEKICLLKEVHHRVKNNLQIVASILGLQANRAQNPQVADVLQNTRDRVRSMALLHEALYRSGNLARIDFAAYVENLCAQLLTSLGPAGNGRVRVEVRVAPISLSLEQAVPCGLIINELVSNAMKHGFPDERSGKIVVELDRAEGQNLVLSVRDDGVGLSPAVIPENTSTLGLKLVFSLSGQLDGNLSVERPGGSGTVFKVVFPAPA